MVKGQKKVTSRLCNRIIREREREESRYNKCLYPVEGVLSSHSMESLYSFPGA